MATFGEALTKLGITPTPGRGGGRLRSEKDYAAYRNAVKRPLPSMPSKAHVSPVDVSNPVLAPSGAGVPRHAAAIDVGDWRTTQQELSDGAKDDGGGNFWSDAFKKFIEVVDTPRAYGVSAIKEATDAIYGSVIGEAMDKIAGVSDAERAAALKNQGDASWDDFTSQAKRHMGFREVMDTTSESQGTGSTGKGGVFSVAGFAGDVIGDPTTYLTLGTSTAAGKAVKGSMKVAVEDGGAKMLSKELARAAERAGLKESASVQKLIVESAERGRGAITPRGLARAGVTAAEAEQLGIPTLARTLGKGGIELPGTRMAANLVEDVKGGVKNAWRARPAAKLFRKTFTTGGDVEKALVQAIYDTTKSVGQRADAVFARATVNEATAVGRRWADDTIHRVVTNLDNPMSGLDNDTATLVTHAVETGQLDELASGVQAELRRIHDDAIAHGVELGDLGETYVPHQTTDDWYKLAKNDPDAAKWVTDINTRQGFTQARNLRPGDEFLGETLETATIQEMNDIAMRVKGVKIFEDDIRDILPKYVASVGMEIRRANQIRLLTDAGLARPLAESVVRKAELKSGEKAAELVAAKKALARYRGAEQVAMSDGTVLRRDAIQGAIDGTRTAQSELQSRLADIDHALKQTGRERAAAQRELARTEAKVSAAQTQVDQWTAVVKGERGPARRKAMRELKIAQQRLDQASAQVAKARETATKMMSDREISLPDRVLMSKPVVASESAWRKVRDESTAEVQRLQAHADELRLKQNPPGEGPLLSDARVKAANERLQMHLLDRTRVASEVEATTSVWDRQLADKAATVEELDRVNDRLNEILGVAKGNKMRKVSDETTQELTNRVAVIKSILERDGLDPQVEALAKLEASAAIADAAVRTQRDAAVEMEAMIKALGQKEFVDVIEQYVEKGMVQVGENLQMPEWLAEATKIEHVRKTMPLAGTWMGKYYNLFKGYAILRPGFHVRNAYSAMFNMYLEAGPGSWANIVKFDRYLRLMKNNPDNYMELAVTKFGAEEADRLSQAWSAAAASGSGQAAGEFSGTALHGGSFNPLNENNGLLQANRKLGEKVENHVRGAHAYDVLSRGGTLDQAVDTLNKWHFNYLDISDFDRNAKLVNPFWVFWSRNLALQAQTFGRNAFKLNRSYMNIKRNLEYGQPEDTLVPEYFQDEGAIRLPYGTASSVPYLFPDLPQTQFAQTLDQLTHPQDGRLLANMAPYIKLPAEQLMDKQSFSGVPFKNVPTEAGAAGQLLNLLPGSPGVVQGANGPMMDDKLQYMINGVLPGLGVVDRLFPNNEAGRERQNLSLLGFGTGVGIRYNNDRTRRGEQYRQLLAEQQAAAEQRALQGG